MSAGFDAELFHRKEADFADGCSVVSLYEDETGREGLMLACRSLADNFKNELNFHFDWFRFKYLSDPEVSSEAARSALQADLILIAPRSSELPNYVQTWLEGWLPSRPGTEGALVLVQSPGRGDLHSLGLRTYLSVMAKRTGLDYFRVDSSGTDLIGSLLQRRAELASESGYSMRWGINE